MFIILFHHLYIYVYIYSHFFVELLEENSSHTRIIIEGPVNGPMAGGLHRYPHCGARERFWVAGNAYTAQIYAPGGGVDISEMST